MKREDFKDFNEYEKACELKCIQSHEALRKYRLSKVNSKSPLIRKFLLWFYGLEKVNKKYFSVDENGNIKNSYFSEYEAKFCEDNDRIVVMPANDYDLKYHTPFDTIRYKLYLSWVRKIERKGLKIKKPWIDTTIRYWPQEEYSYGKFRRLKRLFHHKYHNCIWDASDSTDEIIRLTVAGMYHILWGHSVEHRENFNEIWTYRKMLIKSLFYDEYFEYYNIELKVKEKFGIPYNIEVYSNKKYLENGITAIGENDADSIFNATISPILVETIVPRKMNNGIVTETNKEYRKRVLDKVNEIESFVLEKRQTDTSYEKMNEEWKKLKLEAAEFRVNHENGWND